MNYPVIDWTKKDEIETLFPSYRREQLRMDAEGKPRSKAIEIVGFSLRNPNNTADIFVNTNLTLEANKRCAVYGVNGSGKTCLFEAFSSGAVRDFPSYMHMHHMKELERDAVKDELSVLETVLTSHEYRNALVFCETELQKLIDDPATDPSKLDALKANLIYVSKSKANVRGNNAEKDARAMLRVLGFDEVGENAPLSSLSGGLRMRVALACAFFIDPDVLLLDEPTNHLDLPSVLWLENKLRGYKGAFLLVTHDRQLLENVVTSVLLIQDYKLINYPCDFKEFEKRKEQDDKAREKMIDQFLKRNNTLNTMSPLYKTQLEYRQWQRVRRERQILLQGKFTFSTPLPLPAPEGVSQSDISLIEVDNVRFSYDEGAGLPFIFDIPISYTVTQKTRVGIMGPNGAGKSTFLKLITGKLEPTSGKITRNPDFVVAYFGQHSTKELDLDMNAIEFMMHSFPKVREGILRNHLMKTSVGESIMESRMRNLSFSQRSCVIFAKLTFVPPHLLIMDEPTNFLDLDSVESLIGAARKFTGGLIVVTHNRDFLKRTTTQFLSIVPMAFLEFGSMKEAERATYSFISSLEQGKEVDFKKAIQENRGGGAVHTESELAERAERLNAQQKKAKDEADALAAETARLAELQLEKEKKRAAKLASQKVDWVADEKCWAPIKGKFVFVKVVRNVPGMGVTVELPNGTTAMVEAKKLKLQNPEASGSASESTNSNFGSKVSAGKRGGGRGGGSGRGSSRGGRARGKK